MAKHNCSLKGFAKLHGLAIANRYLIATQSFVFSRALSTRHASVYSSSHDGRALQKCHRKAHNVEQMKVIKMSSTEREAARAIAIALVGIDKAKVVESGFDLSVGLLRKTDGAIEAEEEKTRTRRTTWTAGSQDKVTPKGIVTLKEAGLLPAYEAFVKFNDFAHAMAGKNGVYEKVEKAVNFVASLMEKKEADDKAKAATKPKVKAA